MTSLELPAADPALWRLDPHSPYLNHGSFGACPRAILDRQRLLQDRLENQPVTFFVRDYVPFLDAVRAALASFLGGQPANLAFIPNATAGVNAVLRSLEFKRGEQILVTDHAYNACRNAVDYAAARAGAEVVVARLPFPIPGPEVARQRILDAVTSKTRLAMLDHVSSPTGIVLPIQSLVRELDQGGIDTLVDGAHAPGMVPVRLDALGAAYYTGNCHKWLCAPKGAGFLYVRPNRQDRIRPLAISHGANSPRRDRSRFLLEFDWTGTSDVTPWLCLPAAIEFMSGRLPGGWPEVMERNRALALAARRLLAQAIGVALPCPDSMIGSIASIPLPADGQPAVPLLTIDPLQEQLFSKFQIEIPVMPNPSGGRLLRISCQLYNSLPQYRQLASALARFLPTRAAD